MQRGGPLWSLADDDVALNDSTQRTSFHCLSRPPGRRCAVGIRVVLLVVVKMASKRLVNTVIHSSPSSFEITLIPSRIWIPSRLPPCPPLLTALRPRSPRGGFVANKFPRTETKIVFARLRPPLSLRSRRLKRRDRGGGARAGGRTFSRPPTTTCAEGDGLSSPYCRLFPRSPNVMSERLPSLPAIREGERGRVS